MKMRIVLDSEWDKLVDLTGGDNAKIHWERMASWVSDPENESMSSRTVRATRGYYLARDRHYNSASYVCALIGFRPAVDGLITDTVLSEIKEGGSAIIGTLYMHDKPVRVPQKPTWNGDVEDYIHGAKLEMREALPDLAYQVTGIRVGDAFVADRCLLKYISYKEIEAALC